MPAKVIDLVMEATNYDKARELWYSFHNEVKYHHRFFPSHPVLDKLAVFAEQCKLTVNAGKIYYRARIIDDNALSEHMIAKCFRQENAIAIIIRIISSEGYQKRAHTCHQIRI